MQRVTPSGPDEHAPRRRDVGHDVVGVRCQSLQHETAPLAVTTQVLHCPPPRDPRRGRRRAGERLARLCFGFALGRQRERVRVAPAAHRLIVQRRAVVLGAGAQCDHAGRPAALDRIGAASKGAVASTTSLVASRLSAPSPASEASTASASAAGASIEPTNDSLAQPTNGNVVSSPTSGDTRRESRPRHGVTVRCSVMLLPTTHTSLCVPSVTPCTEYMGTARSERRCW